MTGLPNRSIPFVLANHHHNRINNSRPNNSISGQPHFYQSHYIMVRGNKQVGTAVALNDRRIANCATPPLLSELNRRNAVAAKTIIECRRHCDIVILYYKLRLVDGGLCKASDGHYTRNTRI